MQVLALLELQSGLMRVKLLLQAGLMKVPVWETRFASLRLHLVCLKLLLRRQLLPQASALEQLQVNHWQWMAPHCFERLPDALHLLQRRY